jgi:hypothetical protein
MRTSNLDGSNASIRAVTAARNKASHQSIKKTYRTPLLWAALAVLAVAGMARSFAGTFNADFSTGTLPATGVTLNGGAYITNNATGIHLADSTVFGTQSTLVLDDLDAGASITGFQADFDILIGNGASGNADGFSFSFGPDITSSSNYGEEGANGPNDLVVEFDTYDNGAPDNIGIDLKQGGTEIATGPQYNLSFIYQTSFVHCSILASNDTSVTVVYNNKIVYTNFPGAFLATQGQFALGGRTGGAAEDCFLKNLKITTSTIKSTKPFFTSSTPAGNASGVSPQPTMTAVISDGSGATVDKTSVALKVDGTDVTSSSTITQASGTTTITYTPKTLFASLSQHTNAVSFKDSTGAAYDKAWTYTVSRYVTLTKDLAVSPDKTKPGFLWDYFQNEGPQANGGNNPNIQFFVDQVVQGNWNITNNVDTTVLGPATSFSMIGTGPSALAEFVVPTVINMDKGAGGNGHFTPQDQMPGTPGVTSASNGQFGIAKTYLDLPAGVLTMGVTSDDGFRIYAGLTGDVLAKQNAGEFDNGRGAADTSFQILVQDAGVYPFVMQWENGTGGSNVSWWTMKDTNFVLVGDTANGGVPAYRGITSPTPPMITSVTPDPKDAYNNAAVTLKYAPTDGAVNLVKLTIADGTGTKVDTNSVQLSIDNAAVKPTVSSASGVTTVSYTPAARFADNSDHTGTIMFKDSGGAARTNSWNFHVGYITTDTLFIEAEDWDYNHGQYVKTGHIGMDGPYGGGAYVGLGATSDDPFDYHVDEMSPSGTPPWYRPNVNASPGKLNGSAFNDRGYFKVSQWWTLGWNDAGNWQNYTRDFPTNAVDYEVFGHLASGGNPIAIQMDQITAGQGQTDASQTKKMLGVFAPGRATAGWDTLEIFPLTADTNGTPTTVKLSGHTTLRFTCLPGSAEDLDYIAFRPKVSTTNAPAPTISVSRSAGGISITYTGSLQSAAKVAGPWTDVPGTSPQTVPTTGAGTFYRSKQ